MYNTHPHISTQVVSISAKNDDECTTSVRNRKLPSGSRGLGRCIQPAPWR